MINAIQHALQGLAGAAKKAETAATNVAGSTMADPADPSGGAYEISLSEEAVRLSMAETAYKANVNVIRTATEMQDELLSAFDQKA